MRRSHAAFSVFVAVAGILATGCGGDEAWSAEVRWEGEAPFGRTRSGAPNNERVAASSIGPDEVAEWNRLTAECLRGEGFSVLLLGDGRFGYANERPLNTEEQARYWDAVELCNERHPFPGPSTYTEAEQAALYRATVRQGDCFRQQGVNVEEPPSERTWIETRGAAWSPMSFIPDEYSNEDEQRLLTACPQPG